MTARQQAAANDTRKFIDAKALGFHLGLKMVVLSGIRFAQRCDIEFLHREQNVHDAVDFLGVGVAHHIVDVVGNDLPRDAELVLEPSALLGVLVAAGRELVPTGIELLLRSTPSLDPRRRHVFAARSEEVPSATSKPSGCPFRTRCPLATELCAATEPPLTPRDDGRLLACHHR